MEREQFLGRVRSALRGASLPDVTGPAAPPEISFGDPIGRFIDSATAAAVEIVRAGTPAGAIDAVADVARLRAEESQGNESDRGDGTRYIGWDRLDDLVPGWTDAAVAGGWVRVDAAVASETRYKDHDRVGRVRVGITGADVGIAATGSVLLGHGPGRPRSASLLVEHHICMLPTERIVQSLDEALALIDWERTSNYVAITGPSRTGDIESITTLGVHGPRHVTIVLLDYSTGVTTSVPSTISPKTVT